MKPRQLVFVADFRYVVDENADHDAGLKTLVRRSVAVANPSMRFPCYVFLMVTR
jgi:hypothetical protein